MASEYLNYISSQLGISIWLIFLIIIWTLIWKLPALWIAARKRLLVWFIIFALINTMGILEILYIFVLSKMHKKENNIKIKSKKKKR